MKRRRRINKPWSSLGRGAAAAGALLLVGAGLLSVLVPMLPAGLGLLLLSSLALLGSLPVYWRGLGLMLVAALAAYAAHPAWDALQGRQERAATFVERKALRAAWPPFRLTLRGESPGLPVGLDAYVLAREGQPCTAILQRGERRAWLVWLRPG